MRSQPIASLATMKRNDPADRMAVWQFANRRNVTSLQLAFPLR
ncbi:MAG: hypothetical protein AB4050_13440 [Synechococcus sp.]